MFFYSVNDCFPFLEESLKIITASCIFVGDFVYSFGYSLDGNYMYTMCSPIWHSIQVLCVLQNQIMRWMSVH